MQRGRFCLTGGFRDMYIAKNNRMFYALLIAISVQSADESPNDFGKNH